MPDHNLKRRKRAKKRKLPPVFPRSKPYHYQSKQWAARTLCVVVAQSLLSHVAQPDGTLATAVDELVAADRMELRRSDDLRQLLHVGRLDVHNVWQLVKETDLIKTTR